MVTTAKLNTASLMLHSLEGRYLGSAKVSALPATFPLQDCGDARFYMVTLKGDDLLVLRSELTLPKISCTCPAVGATTSTTLGAPGLGDTYCPISQCRRP